MRAGLYLITSILFIIAVAVGVYMINTSTYSFDVLGVHMPSLPVAVWVAVPVAMLAIFSFVHILYYGTKGFFSTKKLRNDINKIDEAIYWSLIKEPSSVKFNSKDLSEKIALLSSAHIDISDYENIEATDKLKEVAKVLKKIESGEWVDLSRVKFAKHLSSYNSIVAKNELNLLNSDDKFALKIVDFKDKYPKSIVDKALDKIVSTQDAYTLKKYAKDIEKERFFNFLNRVDKENDLGLNMEIFKSFIESYELECNEYYKLADFAFNTNEPEDNLTLFKDLSSENEKATAGYLYLLFRYEMLDKVKDILDEQGIEDYKAYRGLLTLKKAKHNIKLDQFINELNACQ